jgi:hypothetical protein
MGMGGMSLLPGSVLRLFLRLLHPSTLLRCVLLVTPCFVSDRWYTFCVFESLGKHYCWSLSSSFLPVTSRSFSTCLRVHAWLTSLLCGEGRVLVAVH